MLIVYELTRVSTTLEKWAELWRIEFYGDSASILSASILKSTKRVSHMRLRTKLHLGHKAVAAKIPNKRHE